MHSYQDIDWDLFWRWEILRRKNDPVDYLKWKADSSRELRNLPQGRDQNGMAPRILDSTCGLGYHALVQHHYGFRVEACDQNERVLKAAEELICEKKADIPIFQARWENLGKLRPQRYDLVFNDEIHQIRPREELGSALKGILGSLKPGGWFVFFFADAKKPDNGPHHAQWDWENAFQKRTAWTMALGDVEVALHLEPERADETLIFEHHTYEIREKGQPVRTEKTYMARNYLWDWNHIVPLLREVGFSNIESHEFTNVHGNNFSMNLAKKEG